MHFWCTGSSFRHTTEVSPRISLGRLIYFLKSHCASRKDCQSLSVLLRFAALTAPSAQFFLTSVVFYQVPTLVFSMSRLFKICRIRLDLLYIISIFRSYLHTPFQCYSKKWLQEVYWHPYRPSNKVCKIPMRSNRWFWNGYGFSIRGWSCCYSLFTFTSVHGSPYNMTCVIP